MVLTPDTKHEKTSEAHDQRHEDSRVGPLVDLEAGPGDGEGRACDECLIVLMIRVVGRTRHMAYK
jgi:hypothetical protein